jgi:hypothetical protein
MHRELQDEIILELRNLLQHMNEKHAANYHFQVLTVVDLDDEACCARGDQSRGDQPKTEELSKPIELRAVIGYEAPRDGSPK